jgi:transposase
MEDVLDVYTQPYDPQRPLICMDETSRQLLADVYAPLPIEPGKPERYDFQYERHGVAQVFLFLEPLVGKRQVKVTEQRTRKDWAEAMRELSDVHYPQADQIVVVLDNLNTHSPASFYQAFEPEEAHRLTKRFEFHYTPKHGSWLNMAEIELSVLGRQCLNRRLPSREDMSREALAWMEERNAQVVKVQWRFTTADARIKLRHLYPSFEV